MINILEIISKHGNWIVLGWWLLLIISVLGLAYVKKKSRAFSIVFKVVIVIVSLAMVKILFFFFSIARS